MQFLFHILAACLIVPVLLTAGPHTLFAQASTGASVENTLIAKSMEPWCQL